MDNRIVKLKQSEVDFVKHYINNFKGNLPKQFRKGL